MFSKAAKAQPRSAAVETSGPGSDGQTARRAPQAASLLSQDVTLEGGVSGEGDLHVDGVIRGDVRVGKLTIGETGHIEGTVFAETVEVRGRVIGALTAKQVRLCPTAYVDGDITHEQLAIESGAFFQGRSLKFQRPAPTAIASHEPATPLAIQSA